MTKPLPARPIPLVYLDDQLLVCRKPCGIAVEGAGEAPLTALLAAQTSGAVYPVHRLDQPVGGLLVLARTPAAAAALGAGGLQKGYLALAAGSLAPAQGEMGHWLYHDPRANRTFAVARSRRGVRWAQLRYTVISQTQAQGAPLQLVAVRPLTGRTHQIRAQLAAAGCPLAGDGRYGSRLKAPAGQGVALWAAALGFCHPRTGAPLRFCAPPPKTGFWALFDGDMLTAAAQALAEGKLL